MTERDELFFGEVLLVLWLVLLAVRFIELADFGDFLLLLLERRLALILRLLLFFCGITFSCFDGCRR